MPRPRWVALAAVAIAVLAFVALRRSLGLEFEPSSMRHAVEGMGLWAPLVYVGIVAFRVPLGLPSQLVLIGGGLVFGAIEGALYGAAGIVISGVVLFVAARWLGRDAVVARVPERLRFVIDLGGSRLGALFVALGTGYPLGPITSYHLLAGVTAMALAPFVLALAVGSLVRAAIFTTFGSGLLDGDPVRLVGASAFFLVALLLPLAFEGPRRWLLPKRASTVPTPAEREASPEG